MTIGDMAPAPGDMTKLVSIHTGNNIHPAVAHHCTDAAKDQADHRGGVNVSNRRTFHILNLIAKLSSLSQLRSTEMRMIMI